MVSAQKIALLLLCALLSGCAPFPPRVVPSQLQQREFQTRIFDGVDQRVVMKAMLNVLQDEGFLIRNADRELGFLSAVKEADVEKPGAAILGALFGEEARWEKSSTIEASVNVSEISRGSRVRVIFQTKVVDNAGRPMSIQQIEDAFFYQDFFSKVDKSIYLETQRL